MSSPSGPSIVPAATAALNSLSGLLGQIGAATCQINLSKSAQNPVAKNVRFVDTSAALANQFKTEISGSLNDHITDALSPTGTVRNFDFKPFADGIISVFDANRFPEVAAWLALFPSNSSVSPLAANDEHARLLKFTRTTLTWAQAGQSVDIYRKGGDSRLLKTGNIIARLSGTTYDLVDATTSLMLDMHTDFFVFGGFVFLINYKRFEVLLDFRKITQNVAKTVCAQVFQVIPVSNATALEAVLLSSNRNLNKIASIYLKPHVTLLNMNKIATVIADRGLPIQVVNVSGVPTLQVDASDMIQVKAYMHILSDDYVRSQITDWPYIAPDKEG